MPQIKPKGAKTNPSAVADRAARGEASLIKRHGKPVTVMLGLAD